jgi:hypothetical protein
MKKIMTIIGLAAASASGANAEEATNLSDFWAKGDAGLDLRYRLELVDQDGFDKKATASTLLTKLWYKSATLNGFSTYLEGTHTTAVGKDSFNSTINGNTNRPVVADPNATELNQAYLQYKNDFVTLKAGRQGIALDNQRFIGTVAFRQNDQTYDAMSAVVKPTRDLNATYGYFWNVNRIFSDDNPLGNLDTDAHLFNVNYTGFSLGTLSAYGYLLDFNDAAVLGLSTATYGLRFEGKRAISQDVKLGYELEYARQNDYKDSPFDFTANYWNAAVTASTNGFTLGAKYELLGSDNGVSFKTPLATLFKFNGWADKFLNTPADGLQDINASLAYKVPGNTGLGGTLFKVIYHTFQSDAGDADYGTEWDFLISKKLSKRFTASVRAAFYNADSFATDTNKIWFTLGAKF